jgi:putative phosphoesterase
MKRIGILSDTHGIVPNQVYDFFKDCDEIWHAGDIGSMDALIELQAFKPLRAVYGNMDGWDIRHETSENQLFFCESAKVLITHIGGYPGRYERRILPLIEQQRPDIFISGHSHILKVMPDRKYNLLHINPGAAGISGFHKVRTLVRFTVDNGVFSDLEVIELA